MSEDPYDHQQPDDITHGEDQDLAWRDPSWKVLEKWMTRKHPMRCGIQRRNTSRKSTMKCLKKEDLQWVTGSTQRALIQMKTGKKNHKNTGKKKIHTGQSEDLPCMLDHPFLQVAPEDPLFILDLCFMVQGAPLLLVPPHGPPHMGPRG